MIYYAAAIRLEYSISDRDTADASNGLRRNSHIDDSSEVKAVLKKSYGNTTTDDERLKQRIHEPH